jgi:hypothetical protein
LVHLQGVSQQEQHNFTLVPKIDYIFFAFGGSFFGDTSFGSTGPRKSRPQSSNGPARVMSDFALLGLKRRHRRCHTLPSVAARKGGETPRTHEELGGGSDLPHSYIDPNKLGCTL